MKLFSRQWTTDKERPEFLGDRDKWERPYAFP